MRSGCLPSWAPVPSRCMVDPYEHEDRGSRVCGRAFCPLSVVLCNTRWCRASWGSAFVAAWNPSGSPASGVKLLFFASPALSLISRVTLVGCNLLLISNCALDPFSGGDVLEGILNIAVMHKPFILTLSETTPKRTQSYLTRAGEETQ